MVRIDLISGESRKWREFFAGFVSGDNVTFTARDFKEVETIRAAAYQFNLREERPFRLAVSARPSENPIPVTIRTEEKKNGEETVSA